MSRIAVAVAALVAVGSSAARSDSPDALDRARVYVAEWQQQMSGLVSEEQYVQHVQQRFGSSATRRLRSDILLVKVQRLWVGFRDIAEVDGRPIEGRAHRLEDLFVSHPLPEALRQARRISDEGARYNLGRVYQNFNVPTTALQILEPDRAARIRFRQEPQTTRDGQAAAVIAFDEKEPPTIILVVGARQYVFSHGRFWVDPATGRILASELRWRLSASRDGIDMTANVEVTYRQDAKAGVAVPQEMTEKYETAEEVVDGHAAYSGIRRFSVAVSDDLTLPQ